jgi:hypothetical protein
MSPLWGRARAHECARRADEFGTRLLLHEGRPSIFGQAIAAKVIDEFFLTLGRCSEKRITYPRPN